MHMGKNWTEKLQNRHYYFKHFLFRNEMNYIPSFFTRITKNYFFLFIFSIIFSSVLYKVLVLVVLGAINIFYHD